MGVGSITDRTKKLRFFPKHKAQFDGRTVHIYMKGPLDGGGDDAASQYELARASGGMFFFALIVLGGVRPTRPSSGNGKYLEARAAGQRENLGPSDCARGPVGEC